MLKLYYDKGVLKNNSSGVPEVLGTSVSNAYYVSENMDRVYYLDNQRGAWHNGDLYLKQEGKKKRLIADHVRIINVSSDMNTIVYLKDFGNDVNNKTGLQGILCICDGLGNEMVIDRDVYVNIAYIQNIDRSFRIFYTKKCGLLEYELFIYNSQGEIKALGKTSRDFQIYRTMKDGLKVIYFQECKNSYDINVLIFDGENIKEVHGIPKYEHYITNSGTEIRYVEQNYGSRKNTYKQISIDTSNPANKKCIGIIDKSEFDEQRKNINIRIFPDNPFYIKKNDIQMPEEFKVYFTKDVGKRYYLACELAKRAEEHRIIPNEYEMDDSENHEVIYSIKQIDDICLMLYTLGFNSFSTVFGNFIWGYDIYGISINEIIRSCNYIGGQIDGHYYESTNAFFMLKDTNYKMNVELVRNILMDHYNIKYRKELEAILKERISDNIDYWYSIYIGYFGGRLHDNREKLKQQLNELESILTKENKIPNKWKNETELFKLVRDMFPTAKVHSMPVWLSPQHLDVYVEELGLAFEYQGIQHFKPVDHFGGEGEFERRLKLDQRKKDLCQGHKVILVEWLYNEPVTKAILKKKLSRIDINI